MHESESEVAQSYLTLSNPMDCSLKGYSIPGIFQARVLEWVAIAFSNQALDSTIFWCRKSIWPKDMGLQKGKLLSRV